MLENLKAATFEVLETMFFIFPENPEEDGTIFQGQGLRAWVPVKGPKNFRVGITVPVALAKEMAANFLGLEKDEIKPDNLEDVVKETANMVAGSFLTKERAPQAFQLGNPEVFRLNLDGGNWQQNSYHIILTVEDTGLEVFLEKTK
ncbi:MAG: chemotaxis protein CheX [Desulfobaccales bacterium]